jgi:hypothetical protein
MTDKKFKRVIELTYMGGGWIPANDNANNLADQSVKGEIQAFEECTVRDIRFHRCYFSFLNYIYAYLPNKFKQEVSEGNFYLFLKHLQGKYKVLYSFKDGTKMVEYESLSFGNMSEKRFREYIKEQLPFIYEYVISPFFQDELYYNIIETIEKDYEKFLSKL